MNHLLSLVPNRSTRLERFPPPFLLSSLRAALLLPLSLSLLLLSTAYGEAMVSGDLIFREGRAVVSDWVRSLDDTEEIYSHVGMLYEMEGRWYVIHATPSELADRPSSVVIDSLEFFLDPIRSGRYQIYRVEAPQSARSHALQYAHHQLGTPFHYQADRGTYCTRLLYDAWQSSGINLEVRFTTIHAPVIGGEYLFPSQLRASPQLRLIKEGENLP